MLHHLKFVLIFSVYTRNVFIIYSEIQLIFTFSVYPKLLPFCVKAKPAEF
jgi:hypothetical protein